MSDETELLLLASYIRDHTAARGVDLWAVETHDDMTAAKWGEITGRDGSTVSRNIRRAKKTIENDGSHVEN